MRRHHAMRRVMGSELRLLHEPYYSLAANMDALITQLSVDTRASIAPTMSVEDLHNLFGELAIFPSPR